MNIQAKIWAGVGGVGGRGRQNSAFLFNTDVCAMYSFEKQNFSNY